MDNILKIKVDFNNDETKALLNFITETQEGKFTEEKPDLTQIIYKRLEIQEQEQLYSGEEMERQLLFGISS